MLETVAVVVALGAIAAIARGWDVRFVLLTAAAGMGLLAGDLPAVLREFLHAFTNERYVIPICCAMGFSSVLKQTGCDEHLVRLLLKPLLRCRPLLLPGTVVAAFLVNIPIVSQTSTAATLGPIALPILQRAGRSTGSIATALLLGASMGGELLNPGAPELRKTVEESQNAAKVLDQPPNAYTSDRCVQRILPLNLLALGVALAVLCWRSGRAASHETAEVPGEKALPRANVLKALVPVVPLALLYMTAEPLRLLDVPRHWLDAAPGHALFETRLIGVSMLVGVLAATLASPRSVDGVMREFFQGAGWGFTHIISLIVAANTFGKGIELTGLAAPVQHLVSTHAALLLVIAGAASLVFAVVCGSGIAATLSLFGFFAEPALRLGVDPTHVGAVVSLASAAGRTMSPVSAVCQMCALLTRTDPWWLARQVALPLLASTAAVILAAILLAPAP